MLDDDADYTLHRAMFDQKVCQLRDMRRSGEIKGLDDIWESVMMAMPDEDPEVQIMGTALLFALAMEALTNE